jgi:imidazolonepropionase-like amidohydrolase
MRDPPAEPFAHMPIPRSASRSSKLLALFLALAAPQLAAQAPAPEPRALRNVMLPGVEGARTILVEQGRIVALQALEAEIPAHYEVTEGEGRLATPALIDVWTHAGCATPAPQITRDLPVNTGADAPIEMRRANRKGLQPSFRAASALALTPEERAARREEGFALLCSAPNGQLLAGASAVVLTRELAARDAVVRADALQHAAFQASGEGYPTTLMGYHAQWRQFFLDARWQQELEQRRAAGRVGPRPPFDADLAAAQALLTRAQRILCECASAADAERWLALAAEQQLDIALAGGRGLEEIAARLAQEGRVVVLDLDAGEEVKLEVEEKQRGEWYYREPLALRTEKRRLYEARRDGALALQRAGVRVLFGSRGRKAKDLLESVRGLVKQGYPKEQALAALTSDAAEFLGLGREGGRLEVGCAAHIALWDGHPCEAGGTLRALVVEGELHEIPVAKKSAKDGEGAKGKADRAELAGKWSARLVERDQAFELELAVDAEGQVSGTLRASVPDAGEIEAAVAGASTAQGFELRASFALGGQSMEAKLRGQRNGDAIEGESVLVQPGGEQKDRFTGSRTPGGDAAEQPSALRAGSAGARAAAAAKEAEAKRFEHPIETDADRKPALAFSSAVLIRGATVHTAIEPAFVGEVLVREGRIAAVGRVGEVTWPSGVEVQIVEATGMHLAPGVVDCHSHMAIERGVNEGTLSITAEVTIADTIEPDDVSIYRALAGGVTTIRQLHGSANTIGGRDSVLKLKWGRRAHELRFPGAPEGVKFALGENPTQARSSSKERFPATRLGVEAVIQRAFEHAADYERAWERYRAELASGADPAPPRRDVRLEALRDILSGRIAVHSHCYRHDEILMLIRAAERHGFRIGTLQHVLEGYKVAHEMAAAGVPGSAFSDWWAYKIEAYDAIPQCAALMHQAGVLSSINSDSDEMIRRLYVEAAKSVRYAGMDRVAALRLVTLHPALQLGIGERVGSIEVGKDADLVLLNGDPLSGLARVQWTMVDGALEFVRRDAFGLESEPLPVRDIELADVPVAIDPQSELTAFVGATIHRVAAPSIERGTLLVQKGAIVGLGDASLAIPAGSKVVDLTGKQIWPGLVSLGSVVGLYEIGSIDATMDVNEIGGDQPDLRAAASINADSAHVGVTRRNGITRCEVAPQGGGPMRGRSTLVRLLGDTWEEMRVEDPALLHLRFPGGAQGRRRGIDEHAHDHAHGRGCKCDDLSHLTAGIPPALSFEQEEEEEREAVKQLKAKLAAAREYGRRRDLAAAGGEARAFDARLDALVPYARGERRIALHADDAQTILDALKFAVDEKLDAVIYGGREAWKVAEALAAHGMPVVIGPVWALPSTRFDPYDAAFANAALLHRAGVRFAIRTADPTNERNLALHAATAAAHGLPVEEAVRAVTLYPAQILGQEQRFGSLAVGRAADLVVTSGHLLDPLAPVERLFIDGVEVDLAADRQSQLYARYKARLERMSGK